MDSEDIKMIFSGALFLFMAISFFAFLVFCDFALFPAQGEATGIISFQETDGLFQFPRVCWRDTAFSECEIMNPEPNKVYSPGNYQISYSCERLIFIWEKASLCTIVKSKELV